MIKRFLRTRQFKKQYQKLPAKVQTKFQKQIKLLIQDIRHPSVQAKKMQNTADIWEGRIDYQYRFTFKLIDETIMLRAIGTHEIYRQP